MSDDYILVLYDDPRILPLIQVNLERQGYRVETASSGAEALDKIKARCPLLLITDDKRVDMSGPELIATLRRDLRLSDLPVILLTGRHPSFRSGDEMSPPYREADALGDGFPLQKPFNPAELGNLVKRALSPQPFAGPGRE